MDQNAVNHQDFVEPEQAVARDDDPWRVLSESDDPQGFMQAWLTLTCAAAPAGKRSVAFLRLDGSEQSSPVARWMRPGLAISEWGPFADAARRLLANPEVAAEGAYERGEQGAAFAALGFVRDGESTGGVVIETNPLSAQDAHRLLRHMVWSRAWVESFFHRTRDAGRAEIAERARVLLDMVGSVTPRAQFSDAARVFAGVIQTDLRADRVAVGLVRKGRTEVEALAQTATLEKSMALLRSIGGAMDEAVDQHTALLFDRADVENRVKARALMRLADDAAMQSVLVLPMPLGGDIVGAVSIERAGGLPFTQDDVDLADALVTTVAPILIDKKERSRSTLSLLGSRVASALRWVLGPRALGWKLAGLALIGGIAASLLMTTQHRIAADMVVQGEIRRVLTAPFDGFVEASYARAGELIEAGDLLAELDDSDLQLDLLRITARRQQHVLELDRATGDRNLAEINILRAQIAQDDAELALIDDQLSRTQIVAPFDGVLVAGDLSQTIGQPVGRGDLLFEVAPLETYRLIALVDEADVQLIETGVSGEVLFAALPEDRFAFTVETLTPVARAAEGINGFDVIGTLSDPSGRVRPGMEGVARIEAGERSYAFIWTRGLIQWLRLRLWAILP